MSARSFLARVALLALLLAPVQAQAATIFAADVSNTLWQIDDTTGVASAVATSNRILYLLAFHPDGTLYAIGSGLELLTVDPVTAVATEVVASVAISGTRGPRDMTFGDDGTLYLGHHRHQGSGSGLGVYEASVVDGSLGDFIFSTAGGGPIGTMANGNILSLAYDTPLSVLPQAAGTVTPLTPIASDGLCTVPSSGSNNAYFATTVDPSSGMSPVAFVVDGTRLCRIDVNAATITSVGLFDASGPSLVTGLAIAPVVPEPSVLILSLVAGAALIRRRR